MFFSYHLGGTPEYFHLLERRDVCDVRRRHLGVGVDVRGGKHKTHCFEVIWHEEESYSAELAEVE